MLHYQFHLYFLPNCKLFVVINTHQKPSSTPRHIQTTRLLCECELYMSNYDNDPEMKRVMQKFHDRTTQRFQEYDERLQEKQQICKDKCDKEIQKIILKDKIEKELNEKFAILQTDIHSDAIPTCICEKSLADKVEKGCLRCGVVFGGGIAPSIGTLGGIGQVALSAWKTTEIAAATAAAEQAGAAAGLKAGNAQGMAIVIKGLNAYGVHELYPELLESIGSKILYNDVANIANAIITKKTQICNMLVVDTPPICSKIDINFKLIKIGNQNYFPTKEGITRKVIDVVGKATSSADALAQETAKNVAASITKEKTSEIAATYAIWQTTIIAAVVAIVVIVLIMVIIYLILRHRRKKKMKKKLQYIKLLEE
ncbi:hypothetical protein PFDG_03706 [Plasmodium falciparum Dd2]|uniref:Rifin n=1 Tax=Plasmodium falciparum (isolate Dd2) TaxID=57267 RepID=A0A0L7M4G6_PLAF4|nr:hypothetical protein PFDG_03706 [Plasmodium falciparum Dd2]